MLSDAKLRRSKPTDKAMADGTIKGLYYFPGSAIGSGKWILRFVSPETGKRRDIGLGSFPSVSIRDARTKAFELRSSIDAGLDPIEQKKARLASEKKLRDMPSFEEAARAHYAERAPGFKNKKHSAQWISTLEAYVFGALGKAAVNELGPADFANCLRPIWLEKPETASRVRQRCDAVMQWCAANGFILASPVGVVDKLLAKQPGKRERVEHQPALPWRKLPVFVQDTLHQGPVTTTRQVLELLILTACRSGEIRQMHWEEIDFPNAVWTIPASRMKAKVTHRIPLSPRALKLLEQRRAKNDDVKGLVFPSRNNTPISDMTLTKFLRDKKIESDMPGRFATAHGFRSSFRDWASENGYPRDVAERALAHTVRNAVEAAYHRTDLLDQRRPMMDAWARFCTSD